MTRFQFSLRLAMLGALAMAAGCEDTEDPGCVGVTCGYDSSTGPIVGTGGATAGDAGLPGAPAGGPGAGTTAGGSGSGALPGGGLPGSALPGGGQPSGGGATGGTGATTGGMVAGGTPAGGILSGGFPSGGMPSGGTASGGTGDTTGGAMLPTSGGGTMPKIPEIKGECPVFKNGTVMVAGHGGVQLTVGAAGKGGALFFYWHGTLGNAGQVDMIPSSVRTEIVSTGGIIASFNGPSSSKAGGDCSGTGEHAIADFDAADQIVACAVKNHGIDPRRVYTTGCSAGGLQSGCMARARSSYVAAAAPNSGGILDFGGAGFGAPRWQDAGKPAIFSMHGGPSDWVIVTFSETSAALNASAKQHGSFVVNCDHQGGHCAATSMYQTAAWQFMKDHPYGAESPWKNGIPTGIPSACKIY